VRVSDFDGRRTQSVEMLRRKCSAWRRTAMGPIVSFWSSADYFRSSLETDIVRVGRHVSKGATSGLIYRNKTAYYSITSSARASNDSGITSPRSLAAF
jgi:hypothetical protein